MSRMAIFLYTVMIAVGLTMLCMPNIAAKEKSAIGQSGREIFRDRCGACHGEDGTGNGPAAGSLMILPADLTLLAWRNGGTFPVERVRKIVGDWVPISAHGSREMPIWGDLFHPKSAAEQQIANDRFKKVVAYLESIQQ